MSSVLGRGARPGRNRGEEPLRGRRPAGGHPPFGQPRTGAGAHGK
jgi:hypothetical protein